MEYKSYALDKVKWLCDQGGKETEQGKGTFLKKSGESHWITICNKLKYDPHFIWYIKMIQSGS